VREVGAQVLIVSDAGFLHWFDTDDVVPLRTPHVNPFGHGFFRNLDLIPPA
jgi:hypothetical protein